jgi:hypothetical protein
LNEFDVRLGDAPSEGFGDGFRGDVTESRLDIWRGDQPFAEVDRMESRVAEDVLAWNRSREFGVADVG